MQLSVLLQDTNVQCSRSIDGIVIHNISCDSRENQEQGLFVALGGFKFKGVDFVADVILKGAVAIVLAEEEVALLRVPVPANIVLITVKDPKVLFRTLALRFYNEPSKAVKTIGITGTNGKTTFTYLMESIIEANGEVGGIIGTVNYRVGKDILPAKNTTPGFIDMQRFLNLLRERKAQYCVMEVSSHALHQGRVDGINFAAAVFSNLTQDHLDYHQTMENYFQAKALLFTNLSVDKQAIINVDDAHGKRLCAMTKAHVVTFGIVEKADVRAEHVQYDLNGTHCDIRFPNGKVSINTKLIGQHNVYNILATAACAYAVGIDVAVIKKGIELLQHIPGRLEAVTNDQGLHVFIDYAHTEDGLVNVLKALRKVSTARITTVFGCGGDRDRAKRPKMGAAVCALSDHAIVTSDNPRSEEPQAIINDILVGFNKKKFEVCIDRKEAIGIAIKQAKPGEIILLAGKGHEDYQILKDRTIAFNEQAIIREYLGV